MNKIINLFLILFLSLFLVSCTSINYDGEYEGSCIFQGIAISSFIPTNNISINNKELTVDGEILGKLNEVSFGNEGYINENPLYIVDGFEDIVEKIKKVENGLFVENEQSGIVGKARYYIVECNNNLYYLVGSYTEDYGYSIIRCYELSKK